ncbi:MAG: ABC transporter substrate-binding protein [Methanobacterium sp.]
MIYALGIGSINSNSEGIVSITDMAGRTVQVPAQVNKVVGTGCSGREIVYLNASDKMVGIEQIESNSTGGWGNQLPYMIAHPELMSLPIVGNAKTSTVNYEKIAELKPDVVFAGTAEQAEDIQSKTDIPTVVVYVGAVGTPQQMDTYEKSLKMMGDVLNKENRAEELVNYINSCEEDLANRAKSVSNSRKSKVYVGGQAYRGVHGITSTNPHYPPFVMLNASNVASGINDTNATLHAIQIDKEQLINWNPDMIFVEGGSIPMIENDTKNPEYQNINAIKSGNVYGVLAYCMYSYNKDEMFANAYYIGKVLYPEQFKDVNPEEKANEIFIEFNGGSGGSVYKTLKAQYGGFKQLNL